MAYELEAVIGKESTIAGVIRTLSGARSVPLAPGVAMIPLTDELLGELREAHDAGKAPAEESGGLSAAVADWAGSASRHGVLAYCSAAYTGGFGVQSAVIWQAGEEIERGDSVNRALRLLGVTSDEGDDEWDTVGLGRFRRTDRWLALAGS